MIVLCQSAEMVSLFRAFMLPPTQWFRSESALFSRASILGTRMTLGIVGGSTDVEGMLNFVAMEFGIDSVVGFGYCLTRNSRGPLGGVVVPAEVHGCRALGLHGPLVSSLRAAVRDTIEGIPWGPGFKTLPIWADVHAADSMVAGCDEEPIYIDSWGCSLAAACNRVSLPVGLVSIVAVSSPSQEQPRVRIGKAIGTASIMALAKAR